MPKTNHDPEDDALFKDAMRGVVPLKNAPKKTARLPPALKKRPKEREAVPEAPLSDFETLAPVSADEQIEFKKSGIQHKVLRNLRSGQYNIEAILDLHGMTVAETKEALYQFLLRCQQQKLTHVLIIHGKGQNAQHPILKNKLNHWLRQLDPVLAFCSAKAKDGRSGAMYVLIKQGVKNK